MVKIEPFFVEQVSPTSSVKRYRPITLTLITVDGQLRDHPTHNIAETCCDSISLSKLSSISSATSHGHQSEKAFDNLFKKTLNYGHIRGSPEFRENVSKLYPSSTLGTFQPENVPITPGAIAANFLLFYTLVGPGDHVICMYPTYQQLYAVPESFGAEVDLWKLKEDDGFVPDIEELKRMIRPVNGDGTGGTKLIIINNPNNPTGIALSTETVHQIADLAANAGNIPILSDEVYRPLFHSADTSIHPPSIVDIYDHGIATGSMSKAFSLAELRVGWIAARQRSVIELCATARDYNTISVSQIDDGFAAYALSPIVLKKILERNVKLCNTNLSIPDDSITHEVTTASEGRWKASYVKPIAGTTAFVKLTGKDGNPVDDKRFCEILMKKKGVMFLPGGLCFGHGKEFDDYLRIGYACSTEVLKGGLKHLDDFLREEQNI